MDDHQGELPDMAISALILDIRSSPPDSRRSGLHAAMSF